MNNIKLNKREKVSAVYENRAELLNKHLNEVKGDKVGTLEYLHTRNPDNVIKTTPSKHTIEL